MYRMYSFATVIGLTSLFCTHAFLSHRCKRSRREKNHTVYAFWIKKRSEFNGLEVKRYKWLKPQLDKASRTLYWGAVINAVVPYDYRCLVVEVTCSSSTAGDHFYIFPLPDLFPSMFYGDFCLLRFLLMLHTLKEKISCCNNLNSKIWHNIFNLQLKIC